MVYPVDPTLETAPTSLVLTPELKVNSGITVIGCFGVNSSKSQSVSFTLYDYSRPEWVK